MYGGEETYRTRLTLTVLDDDEWDLLWEKSADRPAETEALLAGDLPEDLLEAVEDARVRMLPGYGDLDADCDCDALDHPCPHATALAYQLSWLLDTDPWLLLLIRGRTAEEAVEELKSALLLRALTGPDEPGEPVETEPEEAAPPPTPTPPSARPTPAPPPHCPPCRHCPTRRPPPRNH